MFRFSRLFVIALISISSLPLAAHGGMLSAMDAMSSTVLFEGQSSFSGLTVRTRLHPERLIKEVELMPSFEYWRNSSTVHPYNIHAARKDATLAFDARYVFSGPKWQPYIGAGWAVHFLSSRVNAPALGIPDAHDSIIKGSLGALAGVTYALSDRIDNILELKYHHLSDYRQLKINWGLSFKL